MWRGDDERIWSGVNMIIEIIYRNEMWCWMFVQIVLKRRGKWTGIIWFSWKRESDVESYWWCTLGYKMVFFLHHKSWLPI